MALTTSHLEAAVIDPDKEILFAYKYYKILVIFLPINLNICCGCSKEPSQSFEYKQHIVWLRNKENNFPIHTLTLPPAYLSFSNSP